MNLRQNWKYVGLALVLLVCTSSASADLAAVGPTDPVSGFPLWFQDSNGVALELWPFQNPATGVANPYTISAPPDPANPYSMAIGFDDEAFWWAAEARIDLPGGGDARLILAQEAAFMGDASAVFGNNFSFGRLRIRFDPPVSGVYTVVHPFGTNTFNVDLNVDDRVFYTNDNGDLYPYLNNRVLGSAVGPFLTSLAPGVPAGFIGDTATEAPVTGSPAGNNFFRLIGPDNAFSNDANTAPDVLQTSLFTVMGKLYTGQSFDVAGNVITLDGGLVQAAVVGTAGANNILNLTGGTLAADQINADVVQTGGVVAPGASPGETEIDGSYDLGAAGVLSLEIAGLEGRGDAGGHDFVRIKRQAMLGGKLSLRLLDSLPGGAVGAQFDIIRYDEQLTGGFAGLSDSQTFLVGSPTGQAHRMRISYGDRFSGLVSVTFLGFGLTGDANDSGQVNDDDLSLLLSNWRGGDGGFGKGDMNSSGDVDDDDLSLLLANWNGGGTVPEPATIGLLVLGGIGLIRRRR